MRSWRLAAGFINGQYAGFAPPSLVAATNHSTTLGPSVSVNLPAYKAGDLMIACVMYRSPIVIPSGWATVASSTTTYQGSSQTTLILKRKATADKAPGVEGFTIDSVNGTVARLSLQILLFRSQDVLDVIDSATNSVSDTGGYEYTAPLKAVTGPQVAVSAASTYLQDNVPPIPMSVAAPFTQTSATDTTETNNQIRMGVGYSTTGVPAAKFTVPSNVAANSWSAVTILIGKPAPVDTVAYFNDFETNADGLTGSWTRTTKWAKSGTYSVGSTNQGVNSSDNIATLALSLSKAARVTFNGYTQGETGQDGFWVDVNGTAWDGTEITYPNGSSGSQVNDNGGHKLLSSASGIEFAYSKIVTPGSLAFRFGFRKDGSVDIGLDGVSSIT